MVNPEISLTKEQLRYIRRRVREGMEDIEAGRFTEYEGRDGLKKLTEEVKTRCLKRMAAKSAAKAK
jgi:predicted transcriptional regulator